MKFLKATLVVFVMVSSCSVFAMSRPMLLRGARLGYSAPLLRAPVRVARVPLGAPRLVRSVGFSTSNQQSPRIQEAWKLIYGVQERLGRHENFTRTGIGGLSYGECREIYSALKNDALILNDAFGVVLANEPDMKLGCDLHQQLAVLNFRMSQIVFSLRLKEQK